MYYNMKNKPKIFIETTKGTFTLKEIAEMTGIRYEIIRGRYYNGWRGDELLKPYAHESKLYFDYMGKRMTLAQLAEIAGTTPDAMFQRIKKAGMSVEEAVSKSPKKGFADRVGEKHGHLTILSYANTGKTPTFKCRCDCGKIVVRMAKTILREGNHSCGCMRSENITTHGKSKTREHAIWRGILQRCYNPKRKFYELYGGAGITVCERWRESFENFLADMGEAPGPEYSIDRIDCKGNYSPENCRWATPLQQARNKKNTTYITFEGETKTATEWADYFGCYRGRIRNALKAGWDMNEYLTRLKEMKELYGDCNRRIDTGHHKGRKR